MSAAEAADGDGSVATIASARIVSNTQMTVTLTAAGKDELHATVVW